MTVRTCWMLCVLMTLGALGSAANAADKLAPKAEPKPTEKSKPTEKPDPEGTALFESKIRPVLVEHCYKCHSAKSGQSEGSLLLDSRAGVRQGGDRGPAVVPGDVEKSWLYTALSHADDDLQMPPKKPRLPETVLADFKAWIKRGAPDPRDGAAPKIVGVDIEAGRQFWAYKPPVGQPLPAVKAADWPKRDLDRFILAQLESQGLAPSPDAPPAVLLRRVYYDLVGLPPAPQATAAFLERVAAAGIDTALAREVDELLASPRYAERWGKHWLDVARFAESSGKESNFTFPHAWRYRNWVLDAFHADKPYDRFVLEQIAGDLLPANSDVEREQLLIATGFLAVGPKSLNETNHEQFLADIADEQIDATTQAVLATTVACARCHDHKFDPFTMRDYYGLAGIFKSTKTFYGTVVTADNQVGGDLLRLPATPGQVIPNKPLPVKEVERLKAQLAALKKEGEERQAAAAKAIAAGKDPTEVLNIRDILRLLWTGGGIEGILKTVDDQGNALPLAMGVGDLPQITDAKLLERGEIARPGATVARGFPQVITVAHAPTIPAAQSGRLELAQWLTRADHPLTARVMANRIWQHLLGAGIVRTVDNFGQNGERPSHPQLLDHLALRFVAGGWSIKSLVREVVLSRTYRQASTYQAAAFQADPENRWLWRANKRRMDAEAIRDGMLLVAGQLDVSRPRGSLAATIGDRPVAMYGFYPEAPPDLDGSLHRSVYLPVLRDRLPDVLELFDGAEPSLVTGARETTNVPLQALYLMNSPFVRDRAKGLADRLRQESDQAARISQAFWWCFAREPDKAERELAEEFFRGFAAVPPVEKRAEPAAKAPQKGKPKPAVVEVDALTAYCQALLATAEFRNVD